MGAQADWDLTPYFSGVGRYDFQSYIESLKKDLKTLRNAADNANALEKEHVDEWAETFCQVEDLHMRFGHLSSYLGCAGAADSKDDTIKKESASLAVLSANLRKLFVVIRSKIRDCTDESFKLLLGHPRLVDASYFLKRMRANAQSSMETSLEELSADLAVTGLDAWGRLYDQISGTLTFKMLDKHDAEIEKPVSMTRSLLEDSQRSTRQDAFHGAALAWEKMSETVAASLNAIAGTRLTLYKRRRQEHFLDQALFDAGMNRETLECMLDTVRARQTLPRKYLAHKAKLLGLKKLAFYDLMAPLPVGDQEESRMPWNEGEKFIQESFASAFPELGELASRAFQEKWIDHTPRDGKRPGGFCSSSHLLGQSRIFMTYQGASGDVQTLAHELGHAYHSFVMRDIRSWGRRYPMPLAETASTFAENLTTTAVLSNPETSKAKKRSILDARLQDAEAFMLNIPMRFDFEHELYTKRADGELSVKELCEMMTSAQIKNYGDALDHDALDPWFWASKLHFYITGVSFYNFPYTFGYLFSAGLFKQFLDEGSGFLPAYRKLLRKTGSASVEEVAKSCLGIDLTKPEFWSASIDLIQADFDQFLAS